MNTTPDKDPLLLVRFNSRDTEAFAEVYRRLYGKLRYFTERIIYGPTIDPDDLIQDVFVKIWEKRGLRFPSLEKLENYIYISIRNTLRNNLSRNKLLEKYYNNLLREGALSARIAETEVVSFIAEAEKLLPAECARVFRMHVEGWDVKDIARTLGKSESTVYKQQQKSVSILRSKLPPGHLPLLTLFF